MAVGTGCFNSTPHPHMTTPLKIVKERRQAAFSVICFCLITEESSSSFKTTLQRGQFKRSSNFSQLQSREEFEEVVRQDGVRPRASKVVSSFQPVRASCSIMEQKRRSLFVRQTQLTRFLLHINTAICIRY